MISDNWERGTYKKDSSRICRNSIVIFAFFFIITGWVRPVFAAELSGNEFLNILKTNSSKIETLAADFIITVGGGKSARLVQKGQYFVDNEKGYSKIEYSEPVYQCLLQKGKISYIKNNPSQSYKQSDFTGSQASQSVSDFLQIDFLKQYEYRLENEDENTGLYIFSGYQGEDKAVEIVFDRKSGTVKNYTLIGNEAMPSIKVQFVYSEFGDRKILIPVKIISYVQAGVAVVKSMMELRNIKVNEEISESVFK